MIRQLISKVIRQIEMLVNADFCISRQSENGENCVTGNGVIGEIPISPQSGGALKSEVDGSQRVRLGGCF